MTKLVKTIWVLLLLFLVISFMLINVGVYDAYENERNVHLQNVFLHEKQKNELISQKDDLLQVQVSLLEILDSEESMYLANKLAAEKEIRQQQILQEQLAQKQAAPAVTVSAPTVTTSLTTPKTPTTTVTKVVTRKPTRVTRAS